MGTPARANEMQNMVNANLGQPGKRLANVTFTDLRGVPFRLSEMPGKVRVLHYWATWCGPCIKELPAVDRAQEELGLKGLHIIPVSVDTGPPDRVQAYWQKAQLAHLTPYIDPKMKSHRMLGLAAVPISIFIDRRGNELARANGPVKWDDPEVRKTLLQMLESPPNSH